MYNALAWSSTTSGIADWTPPVRNVLVLWTRIVSVLFALTFSAAASQAQTADFTSSATNVCPGSYVDFTDLSTGSGLTYSWSFPGGFPNVGNTANPTIFYSTPGNYTVTLTVCDGGGSCVTETRTAFISVAVPPVADFDWSISNTCNGLDVQFTDASASGSTPITSWFWDYGDGSGGAAFDPLHSFSSSGSFDVLLLVTDGNNCQDDTTITVSTSSVLSATVSFDSTVACGGGDLPLNASASVAGGQAPYTYTWDFGDGNSGSSANAFNLYTSCGSYDINVTIVDDNGCSTSNTFYDAAEVFCPTVDLIAPDTICVGEEFSPVDISSPSPSLESWEFITGDPTTFQTGSSPSFEYLAPGTYTMTHCARFSNGCEECTTHDVTVQAQSLIGGFSITDSVGCSTPFNTTLTASGITGSPVLYQWIIGTQVLYGPSVTATISSPGLYDVSLIIHDASGCTDTLTKEELIRVRNVVADFIPAPNEGCAPADITFYNTSYSNIIPLDSFVWDLGDGTIYTGGSHDTLIHNYGTPGNYDVELVVFTATGCTDTFSQTVQIGSLTADFDLVDDTTCGTAHLLNLTNQADAAIVYWGNGDSTILSDPLADVSYVYPNLTDTLRTTITLMAYYDGCWDVATREIALQPPYPYNRTVTRDCADPYTVTLWIDPVVLDGSFCWDMGSGDTLCDQNPVTITFPGNGVYEVDISDPGNPLMDTACLETIFEVVILDSDANFSLSDNQACYNLEVDITNSNPDAIFDSIAYLYHIGPTLVNGTTETINVVGDSLRLSFTEPDVYPIHLTALDSTLCGVELFDTVFVNDVFPYFVIDTVTGCSSETYTFSDSSWSALGSLAPLTSWNWTFDNPTCPDYIGTNPPPCTFDPGTYNVRLRVRDDLGCAEFFERQITVAASDITAGFAFAPPVCDNDTVFFQNGTTGSAISSYYWDFGDGTSSTEFEPTHVYPAPGNYTVQLVALDSNGCFDAYTSNVPWAPNNVVPGFTINYLSVNSCPPIPVELVDTSAGSVASVEWIVETSSGTSTYNASTAVHTYTQGGEFDVSMVVTDIEGCVDTVHASNSVFISGPTGTMTVSPDSGCAPFTASFELIGVDASQIFVDFGNGDTLEVFGDFTYTFDEPGVYCPRMILLDSTGCETVFNCPGSVTVYEITRPQVELSSNTLCSGSELWVRDLTDTVGFITPVTTVVVDFGDGTDTVLSGIFDSIPHLYDTPGTYEVKVVVYNAGGCADSATAVVNVETIPTGSYTVPINYGCAPLYSTLEVDGVTADTAWIDFGDGYIEAVWGDTVHEYVVPGVYHPRMLLSTASGCQVEVFSGDSIIVAEQPRAMLEILPDTFTCAGGEFTFINHTIDTILDPLIDAVDSIEIFFDAFALASGGEEIDTVTFGGLAPGSHTIRLIASNSAGCVDTVERIVQVNQTPIPIMGTNPRVCPGLPVSLDLSGSLYTDTYSWSPAALVDDPTSATPNVLTDSTVILELTVSNGDCSITDSITIETLDRLGVSTGPDAGMCVLAGVEISASIDEDPEGLEWFWSPIVDIDDPLDLSPMVDPEQDMIYTFTARCGLLEESEDVYVDVYPEPRVEVTGDTSAVIAGMQVPLLAEGTGGTGTLDYMWQPNPDISCTDCPDPIATPQEDGWFRVQVVDDEGCVSIDSIFLRVYDDCLGSDFAIGKAFTPNYDGLNDRFEFRAETAAQIDWFRVWSRWGELIHEGNSPRGWDGRYRGQMMQPGVYVYAIQGRCINGERFTRTGDVTLIR